MFLIVPFISKKDSNIFSNIYSIFELSRGAVVDAESVLVVFHS